MTQEKALKIYEKLKMISKYNDKLKLIETTKPYFIFNEHMSLESINFKCYDKIYVLPDKIVYIPEFGEKETVFSYKNWNDFFENI